MTSFRFVTIFSIVLIFIFCTNNNNPKKKFIETMIVKGTIKGLRKGKLFLQKIKDTSLINIDSITINGKPNFEFKTPIETAEIFYLYLDKEDGDSLNDRILFFGEKNTIEISNPGHENGYKKFNKKQINSILKLSKILIKKYKIKPSFFLGHSDIER